MRLRRADAADAPHIARRLIRQALDDAEARGIADVELSSYAFNTDAHATFRAMGFAPRLLRFHRPVGGAPR